MQVNSNSFTDEVSKILGFETPSDVPATKPNQSPLDDFLAFDGGGDPKQNIAERNLMDRNQIVQTGLVSAFETTAAHRNSFDYNSIQGVSGNRFVTDEFIRGVEAMAGRLGTRPEYILAVMSFETGGTFNPGIRNGIGATGLIQFLPSTARGLGTTTAALAQMSSVEQLRFVEKYFDQAGFRGRLGTLEGLYTAGLSGNRCVSDEFISGVEAMAGRLGTRPEYILAVMSFETGGTFNPAIRNGIGATGLIQFLPSTARGLGTTTDSLAQMSSVGQLRFVEKYFDQAGFRGRLGTLEGLYTAVLSGRARSNPNDVLFTRGTRAYEQNPLDWNRDGQITAGEAVTPVAARMYGGVTRVQQRLVDLNFVPANQKRGFADGRWGQNTAAAVARFQRAHGIPATGLLDDRTGRALFNLANPAPTPNSTPVPTNPTAAIPTSTLREGNRGAQVRQMQNLLVRFGFMTQAQMNTGPGIFGNRTDTALKSFQRASHLTDDGIYGKNTRNAMRDIISGVGRTTTARNTNLTKGIQNRLVELGLMTRAQVNTGFGTFGPQTEAAVKRFQAQNGIGQTGVVGEQTFRALFSGSVNRNGSTGNTNGANNGNGFSVATNGRHFTVNQGILITDALRPRLQQLADAYFQRTGTNLHVTSGYRPPARQAAAMYDLIVNRGEAHVRNLYRDKTAVEQILNSYRNNRGSRSGAISAMTRTIENQVGNGTYISSHLRSRALDVSISTNLSVLRQIVGQMGGSVLNEGDHYHIQL